MAEIQILQSTSSPFFTMNTMLRSAAALQSHHRRTAATLSRCHHRFLSDAAAITRPVRRSVTPAERSVLRAERKERATRLQQQQQHLKDGGAGSTSSKGTNLKMSRWMWYAGVGVPSALLIWGMNDSTSPPAVLSNKMGLTKFVSGFTDQIAKPSHDKLLPDWSQMPNVPHDIPIPRESIMSVYLTICWELMGHLNRTDSRSILSCSLTHSLY